MKKFLAIIFALALVLSFAACGKDSKSESKTTTTNGIAQDVITEGAAEESNAVADYVNANKSYLISSMEESFATSSGMTCTSDIEVVGNGFIIDIYINELSNVDEEIKDTLQSTYDSMDDIFVEALEEMQKEVPELEYYTINVCDVNGDVLAVVTAMN